MSKNKSKLDIKMVIEMLIVPLALMYLYHMALHDHPKVNLVFFSLVTFFTCIEIIAKYIREVYIYESKNNFLKILFVIFSFILLIVTVLNIFLKYPIIKTLFIIFEIILLVYLITYAITRLINMYKEKGVFTKNAIACFFSLISFVLILMGMIIYL